MNNKRNSTKVNEKKLMSRIKFAEKVICELIVDFYEHFNMVVTPVSITVAALVGATCTAVGFLSRYIYDKMSEQPKIIKEEKMNNVIVANIKEAVQVGLMLLMIAGLIAQYYGRRIKKRTILRVMAGNEIQNAQINRVV